MASLMTMRREMPDPRRSDAQRHASLVILTIAPPAEAFGAESCMDSVEFVWRREPLLRQSARFGNDLLSHDTPLTGCPAAGPAAFGRACEAFPTDLGADRPGVLAIDGKTFRRSFDRADDRPPPHGTAVFGADARRSVGRRAVARGENEFTAARTPPPRRTLDGRPSPRHHLSSARLSPEACARAVHSHWAIENSLHRVLDVTFDEDAARNCTDDGPENHAVLRRPTLNLLETAPRSSLSGESANAQDDPTSSPEPSSAKCDSPPAALPHA